MNLKPITPQPYRSPWAVALDIAWPFIAVMILITIVVIAFYKT